MVALIAYAALYAMREMFSLQTQLIVAERQKAEAEIKKAQAEADAKAAANMAGIHLSRDTLYPQSLTAMA